MKRYKMNSLKGLGKLSFIVGICLFTSCSKVLPYQDTSLSPTERAEDLVSRLTLEEKVSLMQHESPAVPRVGIKKYVWWNEALHGVGRAGLATVFPQSIGMAASFNDGLLYDVFTAVSDEARAKHNEFKKQGELQIYQGLTFWTPNINIFRDPRWGRGQETYGEDPYLTSKMGVSVVRGLQGPEDATYDKLHACAKHYAVHSGPEWNRHSFNAEDVDPRDLWETYLPAFKSLVQKANVKEVMCAYNRYEDEPCCGSDRLLQQILRDEWGYDGLVVSDCWAINDFYNKGSHETEPDATHASATAVFTGTDLVVLVDYYVEKASGAQQIEITPDKFGGNYYLEASTLFRDQRGVDMPAEFIIPNCKIQSNFNFTMASSGDPSTFTFTMDAFPDYTRFDGTKKVLAAIQIITEGDDGINTGVREKTAHNYNKVEA